MTETKIIEELIEYSHMLFERKLIHASGGNTSVRRGAEVWISQTGVELGAMDERHVVKVDLQGNILSGSRPSKEMGMHLAMYRANEKTQAVIHAHPTFSIAHSVVTKRDAFDTVPPYTAAFYVRAGRVAMLPYFASGAEDLHHAVEKLAPSYHAILLRQHGMIVAGTGMAHAMGIVEEIEQCCQVAVLTGESGATLTNEQLQDIDRAMGRSWQQPSR